MRQQAPDRVAVGEVIAYGARTPAGAKLFKHRTRYYLRRRAWRYFRRLGFRDPAAYLPVEVDELNVDLLALGAHKFYGRKGVGALYIRKNTALTPMLTGGNTPIGNPGDTGSGIQMGMAVGAAQWARIGRAGSPSRSAS